MVAGSASPALTVRTRREVLASLDGRVTAALLQQRRTLPLHLAAVVLNGRAIGFAGPAGAGKSSLACALADRGHSLLTDDLGAVAYDGGRPALHPGPAVMRIWGSSARQLGWPADDHHRVKAGVDKFAYELPDRFVLPTRLAGRGLRAGPAFARRPAGRPGHGLREVRGLLLRCDVQP